MNCRLCGAKMMNNKKTADGYSPVSENDSTICKFCADDKVDFEISVAGPNKSFKKAYNEIKNQIENPPVEKKVYKPVISNNLNYNWVEYAKENEIELYERQTEETDIEWLLWQMYRDQYPMSTPKIAVAADMSNLDLTIAKKIYKKWSYSLRLQYWIEFVDKELVERRRQTAIQMHDKHINMAKNLTDKLDEYIEGLSTEEINVNSLPALMKMATELEKQARIDKIDAEDTGKPGIDGDNPMLKKVDVKQKDVTDILQVLKGAGIVGAGSKIGVETKDGERIMIENKDEGIDIESYEVEEDDE